MVLTGMITVEDVQIVKYTHRAPRQLPPDTVEDVMTRDVASAHPETPLGEAVRMLVDRDYRALPVIDDDHKLVGVVTNGDLVTRGGLSARLELLGTLEGIALERELAASEVRNKTVSDVMTRNVIRVSPSELLNHAAHLMAEHGIKRLPVTNEEGQLVGILSRVDVLRTMGEDYHAAEEVEAPHPALVRTVGDLMRTDAPAVSAEATLGEVLDAVTATRLNRAVVIDAERRVVGVVSDADLLARLDPGAETGVIAALMGRGKLPAEVKGTAADVMRAPPLTVHADTPVAEAASIMLEARRKVLPITDSEGRLLGVIDRSDLLHYMYSGPQAGNRG